MMRPNNLWKSILAALLLIGSQFESMANQDGYQEIDILIEANAVKIGGTLTLPDSLNVNELVVMCLGSGPQDRDCTLFGFRPFREIAHHLAAQGIASFRYDDKGTGNSTGDFVNSTLEDLTSDVEEIITYFRARTDYPFEKIILLGHSQGGIVAGKVAARNEAVKRLILVASPAVPLGEVVLAQLREEYLSNGADAYLAEAEISHHYRLMNTIRNGTGTKKEVDTLAALHARVLQSMPIEITVEQVKEKARYLAGEMELVYGLPSLASFLYYDPVFDLEQLNIPVLALFGVRDTQVAIPKNKDRMEGALLKGGTAYQLEIFNEANHLFQEAESGKREEYEQLDKAFVEGFLTTIVDWILEVEGEKK